jgi:CheY-like chemotaxis protein
MDLTMPVMDGFTAIEQICQYDKKAQIIVVSADIQELSMEKAKQNGAIGFIKKPVSGENLKSMLTTLGLL